MSAVQERLRSLTSWHADWRGLRVLVAGLGGTGFSVADTLTELGCEVLVVAEQAREDYRRLVPVIGAELVVADLQRVPPEVERFRPDLVVASPGFSPEHPLIRWAQDARLPLWGDIELAWRLRDKVTRPDGTPADWLVITGTNGKTTTTRLAATMLVAGGLRAVPCGNIGTPVLDAIRDPGGFDVLVVELSSHQLWYLSLQQLDADGVSPLGSVCLNLADDHLQWHGSAQAYRDAKAGVYERTRIACVYNKSDPETMRMVEEADVIEGARAIGFDLGVPGPSDFGVVDGILVDRAFLDDRRTSALELMTLDDLRPRGLAAGHMVANILAAAALARACGVPPAAIREAVRSFTLDPHRIQVVAVHDGVRWVDDSKATNPHAAASSLSAFPGSIWVLGGLLKGVDIAPLVADRGPHVKAAIVIGRERDEIAAAFGRHASQVPVYEIDTDQDETVMREVVRIAAQVAEEGDTVLLAPAAASFDQFDSYEHRGECFHDAVRAWIERGEPDGTDHQTPAGSADDER